MAAVINHNLLCRTNLNYFGSEQLIGRKTIIERYNSLENFISQYIDPQYKDFISYPVVDGDNIEFYGVNWGDDVPELFNELNSEDRLRYQQIKDQTVSYYRSKIEELKSSGNEEVADFFKKAVAFVDDDFLFCYDGKVIMGVWGMKKRTNLPADTGVITIGYTRYLAIRFQTDNTCTLSSISPLKIKSGDSISLDKFPTIIPNDGYSNPKWLPENFPAKIKESLTFTATCSKKKLTISFESDTTCSIVGNRSMTIDLGSTLSDSDFPGVIAENGYEKPRWSPHIPSSITSDMTFSVSCSKCPDEPIVVPPPVEPAKCKVYFEAGEHGILDGPASMECNEGTRLDISTFPKVKAKEGYQFKGWDVSDGFEVNCDYTVHALYEEAKLPWWKRFWLWLCGLLSGFWAWLCGLFSGGCLKRLLSMLLFLLLLWLFLFLLSKCTGCTTLGPSGCSDIVGGNGQGGNGLGGNDSAWIHDDPNVREGRGGIYDPHDPYNPVPTPSDGNENGILPPNEGVLPPIGGDDEILPADPEIGRPSIIANRLNILMENEEKSVKDFAKELKNKYPQCEVIYYDDVIKRLQIKCPKEQRESLKQEIPSAFAPEYDLFVYDESLFEQQDMPSDPAFKDNDKTWYLKKTGAFDVWDITKGNNEVVVAIVDNGFNLEHPEFKGKITTPYNVWTHSQNIFPHAEVDHGTHVAGTAIALADNGEGLCGIAPNCKFMPVQVADNKGVMTITSVLDGLLFALYQGADVINVSLGGSFRGLDAFPVEKQKELINNHFKEEERLWNEISRIAAKHRSTIVVAAGNDNVLAGIEALQRPNNIIVVSAVDKNNNAINKASFSNYGEYSKISAPGVDIFSSYGKDGYEVLQGTSMAAPIVTGAVALMKSINDTLTTKEIICILKNTALNANGKIGGMIQIDKALQKVKSGESFDCTPVPSTGDVQVLLSWNNLNDLDLSCSDPNGDMIWYRNKRVRSGGQLEIDMNVEYPDSKNPIENIYWPVGGAPKGKYNVYVRYYKQHVANATSPFKVKVKYGSEEKEYEGTLERQNDVIQICSFVLGDPNNNGGSNSNPSDGNSSVADNRGSDNSALNDLEAEKKRLRQELDRVENEIRKLKNSRN